MNIRKKQSNIYKALCKQYGEATIRSIQDGTLLLRNGKLYKTTQQGIVEQSDNGKTELSQTQRSYPIPCSQVKARIREVKTH